MSVTCHLYNVFLLFNIPISTVVELWLLQCLFPVPPVLPKTPTLTASSNSSVLLTSTKLTLTCKSGSTDHITYKFQLNGHDVSNSGSGATYTVPQTVSTSANKYTCFALHSSARSAASQQISVRFVGELCAEHSGENEFFWKWFTRRCCFPRVNPFTQRKLLKCV